MKKEIIIISAFLFFLALSQGAMAFGSVQMQEGASFAPGMDGQFKILFFNSQVIEGFDLSFETVKKPEDWTVNMEKNMFIPHMDSGSWKGDYEHIFSSGKRIKAKPLEIFFEVPWWASNGDYKICISASVSGESENTVSIRQERIFCFDVVVDSEIMKKEITIEEPKAVSAAGTEESGEIAGVTGDIIQDIDAGKALVVITNSYLYIAALMFLIGIFLLASRK